MEIAIDTETTGLDILHDVPFLISGMDSKGNTFIWETKTPNWKNSFIETLEEYETIVLHNAKFDIHMLMNLGIDLTQYNVIDTMIMAHHANEYEPTLRLEALAKKYLKMETPYNDAMQINTKMGKKTHFQIYKESLEDMKKYALEDVKLTLLLYHYFHKILCIRSFMLDMEFMRIIVEMERVGVKIDVDKTMVFKDKLLQLMTSNYVKLMQTLGEINFDSHVQIKQAFKERYNIDLKDTQAITLFQIDHPAAKLLTEYRRAGKIVGTYIHQILNNFDRNCRLHTDYMQFVTKTGRLSSRKPNLQNLPRENQISMDSDFVSGVRGLFIPDNGKVNVGYDFSQIELRIFASNARVERWIRTLKNGEDIYAENARTIFGKVDEKRRYIAKQITLGLIYGMGPKKFSQEVNRESLPLGFIDEPVSIDQAKYWYSLIHEANPEIQTYIHLCMAEIYQKGYIRDRYGRYYRVPSTLAYKAANAVTQGEAAYVLKDRMIAARNILDHEDLRDVKIIQAIHDEVVFEVPIPLVGPAIETIEDVLKYMNVYEVDIPIEGYFYNTNWEEKQDLERIFK